MSFVQRYAYPLHLIFSVTLVVLHFIYYVKSHDKNYFELMGLNRLFNEQQLEDARLNKISKLTDDYGILPEAKAKIELIKQIYGTLNHVILCQIYDKYGKENGRQEDLLFNSFYILAILQDLIEYLVIFIVMNFLTKDEALKGSRKWIAAVMLMFFTNEMDMYLRRREEFDWFFDYYLSQFAIFDRIRLIRYCMIPCLLTIRLNYQLFNKTSFFKVSDQIQSTLNFQGNLHKKLNGSQYTSALHSIDNNIQKSIENINKQHQYIKEKQANKKSTCAQCSKICFYIFIGFLVFLFFADKNFEIIQKNEGGHYAEED